jgi:ABC-type oligopeptide transport system substrate-binding subunit
MKRTLALLLALLTVIGLLAGCAKDPAVAPDPTPTPTPTPTPDNPNPTPDPTPVKPAEPKIYLEISSGAADSLYLLQSGTTSNGDVAGYLTGTLYQQFPGKDRNSAYYGSELAAEMPIDVNGDGLVWRIKLNKEAKFANGDPITADTWLYSWKENMSPKLANTYAVNLYKNYLVIKNGVEYFGQTADKPVAWEDVGFKKIDDYTIEVTSTLRSRAKAVNFGIVYGMGAFSLAGDLGITTREAKAYIDSYFATYPGVAAYMQSAVESAKERALMSMPLDAST